MRDLRHPYTSVEPVMLFEDAVEQLNLSGERFLFFVEPQTRRGNVLYLRYDGH